MCPCRGRPGCGAWLLALQRGSLGWPRCGGTAGFSDMSWQGTGGCCSDLQAVGVQAGSQGAGRDLLPSPSPWPPCPSPAAPPRFPSGAPRALVPAPSVPPWGCGGWEGVPSTACTPNLSCLAGGHRWDRPRPATCSAGELGVEVTLVPALSPPLPAQGFGCPTGTCRHSAGDRSGPSVGEQVTSLGAHPQCPGTGDNHVDTSSPWDGRCDNDKDCWAVIAPVVTSLSAKG